MTLCLSIRPSRCRSAITRSMSAFVGHFVDAVARVGGDLGDQRRGPRSDQLPAEKSHVTQAMREHIGIGYIKRAALEKRGVVDRDEHDIDRVIPEAGDGFQDRFGDAFEAVDGLMNREGDDDAIKLSSPAGSDDRPATSVLPDRFHAKPTAHRSARACAWRRPGPRRPLFWDT